jgi:hypothetical protein
MDRLGDWPLPVLVVGDPDSRIKSDGDESGLDTSWTEVVSRKRKMKPDVSLTTTLGGKQSKSLKSSLCLPNQN